MAGDLIIERQNDFSIQETNAIDGLYVLVSENTDTSHYTIPTISYVKDKFSEMFFTTEDDHDFMHGDIIFINKKRKKVSGVLNQNAKQNTLLVTERCDNLCSFCSQPPNARDDTHFFLYAAESIINFRQDMIVGITGGEPTFDKDKFINFLRILNENNSETPLHILTNGRAFKDLDFVKNITELNHSREVVWGVPVHGHNQQLHDDCVGAENAFIDTLEGLVNLSYYGQFIELRTVVTQKNYQYLENISELISTSMPFISTHAIMNLEPKGWAKRNFEELFVSPEEQMSNIEKSISLNNLHGISSALYNYPLCQVDQKLRPYYHKSISDWKNYYPKFCSGCKDKSDCGGFFTSSVGVYLEDNLTKGKQ